MIWWISSAEIQTDIHNVHTMDSWSNRLKCLCTWHMVSSVLQIGLYINTLLSHCRETWTGGRLARMGGGCLGTHGQVRTLRKIVGHAMTRVVPPPATPFGERHTFYAGARVMGASWWQLQPGGRGVNVCLCPPSPSSDRSSPAQNACDKTGWVHGHAPLATRIHAPPPCLQPDILAMKSLKDLVWTT